MTTQAAEWVYGRSQPHEYAAYLTDTGRDKEALDFLPGAFARAENDEQRAALANTWGVAYNDLNRIPEALVKYRAAMALKPRYWRAWSNLLAAMPISAGEEATWKEAQAFDAAAAAAPEDERPALRFFAPAAVATRDKMLSIRSQLADVSGSAGAGTGTVAAASSLAAAYGEVHDWANARRFIELADPDDPMKKIAVLQVTAEEAIERGDFTAAVAPLETLRALRKASPLIQSYIYDDCVLGYAYGMAGRAVDAEKIFADNGTWSDCVAWRGAVAAHEGRVADAARIWAGGIGAAPDLPESYLQRGLWHAAHNDPAGATADFRSANAGAPHFADPLKAWGDVLASQGKRRAALAKYDAALAAAPGWVAVRTARDGLARGS